MGISDMQLQLAKSTIHSLDVLKDSFCLGLKQFFPLLGAWFFSLGGPVFLLGVGVVVGQIIDRLHGYRQAGPATLVGLIVPGLIIGCCWAGWTYVTLKIARGLPVKVSDVVRPINQVFSGLAVLLISTPLIGIGLMLVIPGALLFMKWQLAPYYVVDQNYGPIRALKQSWRDTDRLFVPFGILDLMFAGLHAASGVTIIGPIFCHMALGVASALVYTKWVQNDELQLIEPA